MEISQIVTGERLQAIADVYLGKNPSCFAYNPWISIQTHKHKYFSDFQGEQKYDNPKVVFCYGYLIKDLSEVIHLFMNPFVLITHNSDENIISGKPEVTTILNSSNVLRWYSQNVGLIHDKLKFLPIGIANRQHGHGNLDLMCDLLHMDLKKIKSKMVYMCFSIGTNASFREPCVRALANKIPFMPMIDFQNHLFRMAEYKFCICPIGNGLDTHRLWECYYLRVVPIMLKNTYSMNIQNTTGLPMVLLDSWSDLFIVTYNNDIIWNIPDYATFDFESCRKYLQMEHYIKEIMSIM